MSSITWTKSWSSSDDGSAFGGADIQNIQTDITNVVNGSIDTTNLAATLTFSDGDFINLAAILHDDTSVQGIRLPQCGASPSSPSTGEGYIAWDQTNDTPRTYDGTAWRVIRQHRRSTASTTDATVTTIETIAIAASTTYLIESYIVGRRTGGASGTADDGSVHIRRCMVTTKTGTVTINATQDGLTQEDQAGWDATFAVSGTNILVRVTGAAGNNISWISYTNIMLVSS